MAEKKLPTVLITLSLWKASFKAICKHCDETISGSTKVSTNWDEAHGKIDTVLVIHYVD